MNVESVVDAECNLAGAMSPSTNLPAIGNGRFLSFSHHPSSSGRVWDTSARVRAGFMPDPFGVRSGFVRGRSGLVLGSSIASPFVCAFPSQTDSSSVFLD